MTLETELVLAEPPPRVLINATSRLGPVSESRAVHVVSNREDGEPCPIRTSILGQL
jgi:hypothetical protein